MCIRFAREVESLEIRFENEFGQVEVGNTNLHWNTMLEIQGLSLV